MRNVLLDTGPLVAMLDRSEDDHERCVAFLEGFSGRLLTTEAVLTEAVYLLRDAPGGPSACLRFVLDGGATVVPASVSNLARCKDLMEKYSDMPMDFADAGLVALAEEVGTAEVFTLDRRGFAVYQLGRTGTFVVWPE
jgi:predicted nucleic acid-binding protein